MKIVETVRELRELVRESRARGKMIGFVPTMGYLHEGHLALMRQARQECGRVVASIFVNPLQFGAGEDFAVYPRDLERDARLCREVGVDFLFTPQMAEIYPAGFATHVEVTGLTESLCGRSRPGHFRGVTTVVSKLFNMVLPDRAYFGQKDAQQVLVIKRMVTDLNMPLDVAIVRTVRENDGLAMSSRNVYLSAAERAAAPILYRALQKAAGLIRDGERSAAVVINRMKEIIGQEPAFTIDYLAIVDQGTLQDLEQLQGPILIALAAKIGKTRLIDNIMLEVP